MRLSRYAQRMATSSNAPAMLFCVLLCVPSCAGSKATSSSPAGERHTAHGHAIAMLEREGESEVILERIEDEDTHWVELPNFGECPYETDDIPP